MLEREIEPTGSPTEYLSAVFELLDFDVSSLPSGTANHCFIGPDGMNLLPFLE
jgi:hypothetical protein